MPDFNMSIASNAMRDNSVMYSEKTIYEKPQSKTFRTNVIE